MAGRHPSYEERAGVLRDTQRLKMASSPHAYVRGSTEKFYAWLEAGAGGRVPEGPPVWICGDCHSSNLGPIANAKGKIAIQIRDLDQTVIGNPAHDLIRLGLSLSMAARGSNLPGVTTARMVEHLVEGYESALDGDVGDPERIPEAVRQLMKRALRRRWKHLARERIQDDRPRIPKGKRFWPLSDEERAAVHGLGEDQGIHHLVTLVSRRDDDSSVEVIDAAYWMKGCSSLGRLRYALLAGVTDRAGGATETCLLDIKEAVRAAAPAARDAAMPQDNAERVVAGARALSPFLGERMMPARLLGRPVVVRELTPHDLKLEIDQLTQDEAVKAAHYLASVVGRAHARQMDAATRQRWRAELARNRSKTLDAPSWLWTSLVELVVGHEAAYLDHCRRYAMSAAAAA
jgi:uncharacterized protein (DUF2252 family)